MCDFKRREWRKRPRAVFIVNGMKRTSGSEMQRSQQDSFYDYQPGSLVGHISI
jgi:hypothetical protein